MAGNAGCCGLLQTVYLHHDPQNYIIEGDFEIDCRPGISLPAFGLSVAVRVYSQDNVDPSTEKGTESENAYTKWKVTGRKTKTIMRMNVPTTKVTKIKLKFEVARDFGIPGAFVVENRDKHEFFLRSATLRYTNNPRFSEDQCFLFYCGSWVYPIRKARIKRVFFSNQLCLPKDTPKGLLKFRQKELEKLRRSKDDIKPWDQTYEYACYNDLGDPDYGRPHARPVLGGTPQFPYPRRLRTGRAPCRDDHSAESRPVSCSHIYVPADERLSHEKQEEVKNNLVDALVRFLAQEAPLFNQDCPGFALKIAHLLEDFKFPRFIVDFFRKKTEPSPNSGIEALFADKEVKGLEGSVKEKLQKLVPDEIFDEVVATAAAKRRFVSSQRPSIITEDTEAWEEDREFGRQMLAGTNPVRIRRITDEKELMELIEKADSNFERRKLGEIIDKARSENKELFILEHHDYLEPFLKMINGKDVCAHATRTILQSGSKPGTIEPTAIELSLPDDSDGNTGIRVIYPDDENLWRLAKFHVACNDAAYHQLISHWLHTHAVVEPFIIATRRQLSVMHPIHRLLDPHFKDTLHINALARAFFLNAGGILETALFTGEYSMQLSSHLYKQWRFDEQALPEDLLKRGMATRKKDGSKSSRDIKETPPEPQPAETDTPQQQQLTTFDAGVKLVLEDYPYAKDGLDIWVAIKTWVNDYCKIFYQEDSHVSEDTEIQQWWKEIRHDGHGDQPEGWYDINTVENLVKALTTLIWITSGLHAALNFGQYGYYGWPPNRPMLLRKFVPRENMELVELDDDRDKFEAQMLPEKFEMAFVIAVMDVLSRHTSDEVYLGQQRSPEKGWEPEIQEKFEDFQGKLKQIVKNIKIRNNDYRLKNRWDEAHITYKLLYPDTPKTMATTSKGKGKPEERTNIDERGIPNSISI